MFKVKGQMAGTHREIFTNDKRTADTFASMMTDASVEVVWKVL